MSDPIADRLIPWLSFLRLPGLGTRGRHALLAHYQQPDALFGARRADIERVLNSADVATRGDREPLYQALAAGPAAGARDADLAWLTQPRCHLLTWTDPDYPPLLRELPDPPVALYVHGDRALLTRPQLAVVGSRNPTPAGRANAAAFAKNLAGAGLTITSGLALGVDGAAHRGALETGTTIAVAGTGLDRVYPPRHRELAHAIVNAGAIVSEFPLGTSPRPENFPVRNRIISGLSLGVLVVEAAERSGSLITARLAAEQGREVFAIPGSIHSPLARGCHALIRQGAKLVETANDVIEELAPLAALAPPVAHESAPTLSNDESELLRHLGYDSVHIDAIIERSGLTIDRVSSMLLALELRGLIAVGPGGTYQRVC